MAADTHPTPEQRLALVAEVIEQTQPGMISSGARLTRIDVVFVDGPDQMDIEIEVRAQGGPGVYQDEYLVATTVIPPEGNPPVEWQRGDL